VSTAHPAASGRALIVTAVAAERDAIAATLGDTPDEVVAGGVGPAAAAATTATRLARGRFDLVLCAGIGGGFAPLGVGEVAVASRIVFADLGAETAEGFVPLSSLGFGEDSYAVPAGLVDGLARRTGARTGAVLTVATVTGSAATAARHRAAHPDAVAEGMEGAGVAAAAALVGVPCAELRAISNTVGPRDRGAWRIGEALATLARAVAAARGAGWPL
jgi:futalosine hydrolase